MDFEMDPHGVTHANTSMHHSREQVAALLPMLQRFVGHCHGAHSLLVFGMRDSQGA